MRRKQIKNTTPKPESPPEPASEFIVRVNRSIKPTYPADWFKKLMHPDLALAGPAEYDLQADVYEWLHDDQKDDGDVEGIIIYDRLKEDKALASCLNLQDGLAIQAMDIAVYRKLFARKTVVLWGSVAQDHQNNLRVPHLFEFKDRDRDMVVVRWRWLASNFYSRSPALRFIK